MAHDWDHPGLAQQSVALRDGEPSIICEALFKPEESLKFGDTEKPCLSIMVQHRTPARIVFVLVLLVGRDGWQQRQQGCSPRVHKSVELLLMLMVRVRVRVQGYHVDVVAGPQIVPKQSLPLHRYEVDCVQLLRLGIESPERKEEKKQTKDNIGKSGGI